MSQTWWVLLGALLAGAPILRHALARAHSRVTRVPPQEERVVILGASTTDGLGSGFLRGYLERGVRRIVIVGRRPEALEKVRDEALAAFAGRLSADVQVHVFEADCTNVEAVLRLRDFVRAKLGGLDTLQVVFGITSILPLLGLANVDPVGVNRNEKAEPAALDADKAGLESVAETVTQSAQGNLTGTAVVLGALTPMLQSTSVDPVVVVTGSVAGLVPAPTRSIYCATKAAQHFFVNSVALECERQAGTPIPGTDRKRALVRFLLVAPGPIKNSFVAKYACDATSGPRDKRDNALEVKDVVQSTLSRVDLKPTGMLVMPRYMFFASLLAQWDSTRALIGRGSHRMYGY